MFGKDSSNNYGYIIPGADTVVPFKYYKILASSISSLNTFNLTTLFPNTYNSLTTNNFLVVPPQTSTARYIALDQTSLANLYCNITNSISSNTLTTRVTVAYNEPSGFHDYDISYNVYYIS